MPIGVYKHQPLSEETKIKMSEAHKGIIPKNVGKREKSPSWKGGKYIKNDGYVYVYNTNHPNHNSNGYIREHRLIAEKYLNRLLEKWEIIHHINGIKNDNQPENLYLFNNINEHKKYHHNSYQLISNLV